MVLQGRVLLTVVAAAFAAAAGIAQRSLAGLCWWLLRGAVAQGAVEWCCHRSQGAVDGCFGEKDVGCCSLAVGLWVLESVTRFACFEGWRVSRRAWVLLAKAWAEA